MSALPPEADMLIVGNNVCYVPIAEAERRPRRATGPHSAFYSVTDPVPFSCLSLSLLQGLGLH